MKNILNIIGEALSKDFGFPFKPLFLMKLVELNSSSNHSPGTCFRPHSGLLFDFPYDRSLLFPLLVVIESNFFWFSGSTTSRDDPTSLPTPPSPQPTSQPNSPPPSHRTSKGEEEKDFGKGVAAVTNLRSTYVPGNNLRPNYFFLTGPTLLDNPREFLPPSV